MCQNNHNFHGNMIETKPLPATVFAVISEFDCRLV